MMKDPLYFSEIVLLTKSYNLQDFKDWMRWHIDLIKCDHIHVFDNESSVNIKEICDSYGSKVSYEAVDGWPDQYGLYNKYVNSSKAEWVLPIDDDEFLWMRNFNTINDMLRFYQNKWKDMNKFSIGWRNLFPNKFVENRNTNLFENATAWSNEASSIWQQGNRPVKTAVRTTQKYEWASRNNLHKVHNPFTIGNETEKSYTCTGERMLQSWQRMPTPSSSDVVLLHYQFKSNSEWFFKCKERKSPAAKSFIKDRPEKYSQLYDKKDTFKEFRGAINMHNENKNNDFKPKVNYNISDLAHVIICSWNRIDGIRRVLSQLDTQTNKDFYVTVINNNIDYKDTLEDIVNGLGASYSLELIHNDINLGGRARFIVAKDTTSKYCIFLDDDQILPDTLIDDMKKQMKPNSICAWWSWQFKNNKYWDRTRASNGEPCNYCATCGMVADSSIFKDEKFWYSWNPEFYFVEDLYLSLYARKINWTLSGYDFGLKFDKLLEGDKNALCKNKIVYDAKQGLLDFIEKNNWSYVNPEYNFSFKYWENRYNSGGNSGNGSYGEGLKNKALLLNNLINKYDLKSISDVGCGECTLLPYLQGIRKYYGYDISPTVLSKISKNNQDGFSKEFILLTNNTKIVSSDLVLSLEVIFHQVNDDEYLDYMRKLVNSNGEYLLILTMNEGILKTNHIKNRHIKYRDISKFMDSTNYSLVEKFPFTERTSTYYLYKKN